MLEPCEPSKTGDDSKTSEIIDIEMQNAKIQLCRMSAVRPEVEYTRLFINNQWVDAVSGRWVQKHHFFSIGFFHPLVRTPRKQYSSYYSSSFYSPSVTFLPQGASAVDQKS